MRWNKYFPAPVRLLKAVFLKQPLSFGESEVYLGLHAVKAQAAAMLCSSCLPSSATYREQTLH
jgi:hypothetical protein